jgi:hypothetical protein
MTEKWMKLEKKFEKNMNQHGTKIEQMILPNFMKPNNH